MKRVPPLENMQIVPEEIVQLCAKELEGEDNNFEQFLQVAKEFRYAGLTPIFLCSHSMQDLYVTTKEKLQKKFH
jgi:hypothetical protein